MNLTDLYLGDQPAWKKVMTRIESVAPTPWPVLLVGPRGSGKTLLAEYVHRRSGLPGDFVPGPAPSIPEGLLQGVTFPPK
jgi:DNA-binding NtrC family response regulator